MEEVLEVYARPYDPSCPVICMDEQPVQLHKEIKCPIPATANHPKRVESLAGWRQATVRERRTKIDWASEVVVLMEGRYAEYPQVILTCDNLNTHTKGAFYEVFEPKRARHLVKRIRFCYTPKHGSWLNVAENELSAMTRQCIGGKRFGTIEILQDEVQSWAIDVNNSQRGVDWQMKIGDTRCKLTSIYPKIKS